MSDAIQDIMTALCSKQKIERDRTLMNLLSDLPKYETSFIGSLFLSFTTLIKRNDVAWESYQGVLQALKVLLLNETAPCSDLYLLKEIRDSSINLISHSEVRVCLASGEVLGALCSLDDCATFLQCRPLILHLIQSNLEIKLSDVEYGENQQGMVEDSKLQEKLSFEKRERRNSGDTAQLFHDAARWHRLETSLKCLEYMIVGGSNTFLPFIDKELLELIFITQTHTNRFVRETGLTVLAAIVSCGSAEDYIHGQENFLLVYGDQLSKHIALGLADNWSQVRYAASIACRKFLMALPVSAREMFFQLLLPRICLNRYYVAEGVKLYSQETWRQVTAMEGRQLVEKYIDYVVPYYIEATAAENPSVREAVCACIGELPLKIPAEAVRHHSENLLNALIVCLDDDLWKVRDVACLASGNLISCFSTESSNKLEILIPLLFTNLKENIPSLRQEAATTLRTIVTSYNQEIFTQVQEIIIKSLKGVEFQPSEVEKHAHVPSDADVAPCNTSKQKQENYMDVSNAKQIYACGSFTPMIGQTICCACRFKKTQPWERADGCIYLIGCLSSIPNHHQEMATMLPIVAECCNLKHYTSHILLLENLCMTLPTICRGLGKRSFKENLHLFWDLIFYSLECESPATSSAAGYCLEQLSQILGPNILRGRIKEFNPIYLRALDTKVFGSHAP